MGSPCGNLYSYEKRKRDQKLALCTCKDTARGQARKRTLIGGLNRQAP